MSAYIAIEGAVLLLAFFLFLFSSRFFNWRRIGTRHPDTAKLVETRLFSQAIFENLPIGIAVFSQSDNAILLENAFAIRMLVSEDAALRRNFYLDVIEQFVRAYTDEEALDQTTPTLLEVPLDKELDSATHVGVALSRTRFSGRSVILIGLLDLSERKKNELLLLQAKDAATQAYQAKSDFIAAVSHEIRTPLHGAVGNLELLARTKLSVEQREHVDMIQLAFDGLVDVVSDILDATKIEAKALTLNVVQTSVNEVVEECAQSFSASILRKHLDFRCETDPLLDAPFGIDANRITQILKNLLSNSVKFTAAGYIGITSRLVQGENGHACIRITVEDSGVGIPKDLQSSLFRPLVQTGAFINQRIRSTGLGLFLSRSLASLMGGNITLVSEAGVGSAFSFELPISLSQSPSKLAPRFLDGVTIDVWCDVKSWRATLIQRLTLWGATIVASPTDSTQTPDILLCARQGAISIPLALSASVSKGAVIAVPTGPREPVWDGRTLCVTSLSSTSLASALRSMLSRDSMSVLNTRDDLASHGDAELASQCICQDILVAEDEPLSQRLVMRQLDALGCKQVRIAQSGDEALRMWRERHADLTITDLSMPGLDGSELLKEIRKLDPKAKIIAMTASVADAKDERVAGFSAFMRKPVLIADLARVLAQDPDSARTETKAQAQASIIFVEEFALSESESPSLAHIYARTWVSERIEVESALANRNCDMLQRRMHRLQGALLTIGEDDLAAHAAALERMCKTLRWDILVVSITKFLVEVDAWAAKRE